MCGHRYDNELTIELAKTVSALTIANFSGKTVDTPIQLGFRSYPSEIVI